MNGENAAPVYDFLKTGFYGILGGDIQWNFSKFLVDKNGQPVDRFYPTTSPLTIEVKDENLCCWTPYLIASSYIAVLFLQRDIQKLLGLL